MTKKHFKVFAELISDLANERINLKDMQKVIESLCLVDNPKFNLIKFRKACQ